MEQENKRIAMKHGLVEMKLCSIIELVNFEEVKYSKFCENKYKIVIYKIILKGKLMCV